jgi:hypothetical protein
MKKLKMLELLESLALCALELVDSRDHKDDFAQALSQLEDEIQSILRIAAKLRRRTKKGGAG